jgi:hypothetical protein
MVRMGLSVQGDPHYDGRPLVALQASDGANRQLSKEESYDTSAIVVSAIVVCGGANDVDVPGFGSNAVCWNLSQTQLRSDQ